MQKRLLLGSGFGPLRGWWRPNTVTGLFVDDCQLPGRRSVEGSGDSWIDRDLGPLANRQWAENGPQLGGDVGQGRSVRAPSHAESGQLAYPLTCGLCLAEQYSLHFPISGYSSSVFFFHFSLSTCPLNVLPGFIPFLASLTLQLMQSLWVISSTLTASAASPKQR